MSADFPGVYAILHRESGRLYVGSSVRHRNRWSEHRCRLAQNAHGNKRLQNAWNKYGESSFDFMLIHEVKEPHELLFWEQFWIDTLNPWFNLRKIAENNLGVKRSPESVEKTASANRGRKRTLEAVANMVKAQRARKPMTPEQRAAWRERLSEAKKGKKRDPEIFKKVAEKLRGRPLSEEHRRKLSESHKGLKPSAEAIAKTTAAIVKEWTFVSPEGKVVTFVNLMAFCREHNLNSGTMQSVNNGSRRSHKGWTRYNKGKAVLEVESVE